jgi:hypothetical protein
MKAAIKKRLRKKKDEEQQYSPHPRFKIYRLTDHLLGYIVGWRAPCEDPWRCREII